MSAGWDEIQKLAADLQRAQLGSSQQRLSERNCIEIVNKLVEMGLLADIIYTSDGKEYITSKHLQREIADETFMAGGRIGIAELAAALNVDYSQIEAQANALVRSDSRMFSVLGQVISSDYLDKVAEEINDRLQSEGTISISVLTKELNLPADFLLDQIVQRVGSIIEGFQDESDPKVITTPAHLARNRARVRGVLNAITVPTAVSTVVNRFGFEGRLFLNLAEELIRSGQVSGVISGGRQLAKATYVPNRYSRAQAEWVDNFLAQNGYLEYDAVARLGISDPAAFVKRRFQESDGDDGRRQALTFLSTCCVSQQILEQVEASVEEATVSRHSFLDVAPLLPSVLGDEDIAQLLNIVVSGLQKASKPASSKSLQPPSSLQLLTLAESVVASKSFLDSLVEPFGPLLAGKASKAVASGEYAKAAAAKGSSPDKMDQLHLGGQVDRKEERRKRAAVGKAGGGTQGRESKTKAVKKKAGGKRGKTLDDSDDDDADDNNTHHHQAGHPSGADPSGAPLAALIFMADDEFENALRRLSVLQEAPDPLFPALVQHLLPGLNKRYLETAAEEHRSLLTSSMKDKKKAHQEFEEKALAALDSIRIFSKGLHCLDGGAAGESETREALEKYLIKTLCSDLASAMFIEAASINDVDVAAASGGKDLSQHLNPDQRLKLLGKMPKEVAEPLLGLHKSLSAGSVEQFLDALEAKGMGDACDILIRKPDKKKDRQTLFNHRQALVANVEASDEPATVLLLVSLLVFHNHTGCALHASGKYVPAILTLVSRHLQEGEPEVLKEYQDLVLKEITSKDEDEKTTIRHRLAELTPAVKKVALEKKAPTSK